MDASSPATDVPASAAVRAALRAAACLFALALPLSIAGANVGWGLILAALLAHRLSGGAVPWSSLRRAGLLAPLTAFLAVSLAASLLGLAPDHSLRFFHQDAHKLWIYALLSVALTLEPGRAPLRFLAAGASAAAVIGIGQWGAGVLRWVLREDISISGLTRAHAFVHPVTYGEQMALFLIGAACFAGSSRGRPRRSALALAALFGAALFLSNTRGAMLAALAGLGSVALALPAWRRKALLAAPLALAAFLAMDLSRWDRSFVAETLGWEEPDYAQGGQWMRLHLWGAAARMGLDHPLTGVGHNNYKKAFPRYFQGKLDGGESVWPTAHNLYLHHFAERGAAGLAALGWLLWAMLAGAFARARESPDAWNLWALGTTSAFLVMNLTEVALQVEILWLLVFFIWTWAEVRHREKAP